MSVFMQGLDLILDSFFPKYCIACESYGSYLCNSCESFIDTIPYQRCIICQQVSYGGYTHSDCLTPTAPDRLITCFAYQQPIVQKLISSAKFMLLGELFTVLAEAGMKRIDFRFKAENVILVPIPLSPAKKRFRGFNQSMLIAQVLQRYTKVTIAEIITKHYFIKQQKLLNKRARQYNMSRAFTLKTNAPTQHVMLIDDVTTSGSTFLAASKLLKDSGVQTVWCFALAQD